MQQEPAAHASDDLPKVKSVKRIRVGGGRVDWCQAEDRIVFDDVSDGTWRLRTMKPDGSDVQCLTCNAVPGLPVNAALGQPAWSSNCKWIVFQVRSTTLDPGKIMPRYFGPGWGVHNDLYVMKADGSRAHRLLELTERFTASLNPHFSDGSQLFWAARDPLGPETDLEDPATGWSGWYLSVADVDLSADPPAMTYRADLYREGTPKKRGFFESHAFKDGMLWFSRTLYGQRLADEGMAARSAEPSVMINQTQSEGTWEEHILPSPGGGFVAFSSSRPSDWNYPKDQDFDHLSTEVWVRDLESGVHKQITHFNDEELTAEERAQGYQTVTSDLTWAPDGKRLVVSSVKKKGAVLVEERIDVVTLDRAY